MKKLSYSPPEITIVHCKVEHCFQSPGSDASSNQSFLDKLGLTFSRETYYSTGESYTEYTTNTGTFSTGDWI